MNLVDRARNILLQPQKEWAVIDGEKTEIGPLFRNYAVPLAAIGPAALIVGLSIIGIGVPILGRIRAPMGFALRHAIIHYVLALAAVFVLALVIDALAPQFGARKDPTQAMKVAVYSSTAAWVAQVFFLIPDLRILAIAGLYSLYLLFLGLPMLMKAPSDKAGPYLGAVILTGVALYILAGWLARELGGWAPSPLSGL